MIRLSEEEKSRRHKERCKAYYQAHKQELFAAQARRRKENPDARKKHDADYRVRNAERVAASKAAYKEKNPEKVKLAKRTWIKNNPEKMVAARAAWIQSNPEKHRMYRENRRALERNAPGKVSSDRVETLLGLQRKKCAVCRCDISKKYEIDHIIPLAIGGTHYDTNIQLLCVTCNRSKGKKHPVAYMNERGLLL